MKITSRITACAVALVLASGLATAATETFQLDANHSSVSFRIRHLVGRVTGNFTEFSGQPYAPVPRRPATGSAGQGLRRGPDRGRSGVRELRGLSGVE